MAVNVTHDERSSARRIPGLHVWERSVAGNAVMLGAAPCLAGMVRTMGYEIHESDDEIVLAFGGITVSGHLELPSHQHIADFCARAATKSRGAVIDFQGRRSVDSSALGWLVVPVTQSRRSGIGLRLANVSPEVREVIEMMGMASILSFDDDSSGEGGAVVLHPKPNGPRSGRAMPPQE